MFDSPLIQMCMDEQPRINQNIARGLAYSQYTNRKGEKTVLEEYIDTVIKCAAGSFPPGLEYHGSRRASPEEQFLEETRSQRSKRTVELAWSDVYCCYYRFTYNGEEVLRPRYLMLPYIRPGSVFRIRGASYTASPVLADNILTIETNQIYMPVTRSKNTFKVIPASFLANGEVTSDDVVYGNIFKDTKNLTKKRKALLVHYTLCKMGLGQLLKQYCDADIEVGHDEITSTTHPKEDWVVCTSRGIAPRSMRNTQYTASTLKVAVPKAQWSTNVLRVMAAVFYVVDHEPDLVHADDVDNIVMWQRLLPRFIKNELGSERKAMEEIQTHIRSVDSYLDELVRIRLAHEGIPHGSIYDVFMYIVLNFMELTSQAQPADSLGKQMEVVRFMMSDITFQISRLLFDLVKLSGPRLNYKGVKNCFDKMFRIDKIMQINTGHGEISTLETATDCMLYGPTKTIVPQSKATDVRSSNKDNEIHNPAYALDASQCVVNSTLFITKSAPSGRESINPFVELTPYGEIVIEDTIREEMERLNALLRAR